MQIKVQTAEFFVAKYVNACVKDLKSLYMETTFM